MALKKETSYKGMISNYWRINNFSYDDLNDSATVSLWLYGSEESKAADLKNGLRREVLKLEGISKIVIPEVLQEVTNTRDLLKSMLYAKIKESKIVNEVETNWFADSEDC